MKRLFIAAAVTLFALSISTSAFAHSHVSGSNPADGEVVTEPLQEITLEFDGDIEQGSYIDVTTTSGKRIDVQEITIGEGSLTGTLAEPLPNDDYQVNWSIISADGHPLEGEFTFAVDAPVSETVEEGTEESAETDEAVDQTTEDQENTAAADEVENESSSMTVILIVLLVVIVAGGLFFLIKRKK